METTPTQSKSPAPFSSTVNLLNELQASLELSIESDKHAQPEDSDFGSFLDRQILLQEANSLAEWRIWLDDHPLDKEGVANYNRILSLFERTRARIARDENVAARNALRELELSQLEPRSTPDRNEACHFLRTELAAGDRPAKELIDLARSIGIAPRTLKRAKADLNIRSIQVPHPQTARSWVWSLPASSTSQHSEPSTQHSALSAQNTELASAPAPTIPTADLAWHTPSPAAPPSAQS